MPKESNSLLSSHDVTGKKQSLSSFFLHQENCFCNNSLSLFLIKLGESKHNFNIFFFQNSFVVMEIFLVCPAHNFITISKKFNLVCISFLTFLCIDFLKPFFADLHDKVFLLYIFFLFAHTPFSFFVFVLLYCLFYVVFLCVVFLCIVLSFHLSWPAKNIGLLGRHS